MQSQTVRTPVDTLDFVKVTEAAALAASRWMGRGERDIADGAAVEAMRKMLRWIGAMGSPVVWFDYTQSPPMLKVSTRDQLSSVSLPYP